MDSSTLNECSLRHPVRSPNFRRNGVPPLLKNGVYVLVHTDKLPRCVAVRPTVASLTCAYISWRGSCFTQVAEAILEWSAGCAEEVESGETPSPAELCSTTDAEGKTAHVFAKEHVRPR